MYRLRLKVTVSHDLLQTGLEQKKEGSQVNKLFEHLAGKEGAERIDNRQADESWI